MKAVILVGGLGTRLRPLTCNTPKPMIPIANRPFIEYMLHRLRDEGITEVVLAVQYLADRFRDALGDGSRLGIKLHISEEPEPLGTAGAVKYVEHLLDTTTFVFNGDVLTDLNLTDMLNFHRSKGSKTTIALTPVEDPTQFGLVETDRDQRILRFTEKPRPEEITTNLINAGTYIIEPDVFRYVPPRQFYMFERGLFPVLLQTGDAMYGYPSRAYWTDIGRPHNYIDVNHDILIGKASYPFPGTEIRSRVWMGENVVIGDEVQIVSPVVIGNNVRIERRASIIGPTVIGDNCTIGAEATLEGAVLWQGNQIGEKAILRSCVVGTGNVIGSGVQIVGGAIVSDYCIIGADNRLDQRIRVWPSTELQDQAITF